MAFIAAALLASCSDDKDYSGDFGQIKVPDTRQLEQTVSADDTQSALWKAGHVTSHYRCFDSL